MASFERGRPPAPSQTAAEPQQQINMEWWKQRRCETEEGRLTGLALTTQVVDLLEGAGDQHAHLSAHNERGQGGGLAGAVTVRGARTRLSTVLEAAATRRR
jgi:hypothetical protein